MAEGAWRVLQPKRAHAQTLSSLQRAEIAMLGVVETLVRLGERHDPYTAGSAQRVAALAVALARDYGLDGPRQQRLVNRSFATMFAGAAALLATVRRAAV